MHSKTREELLRELSTDEARGLTAGEAAKRLAQYGPNKLQEAGKKTNLQRFLEQFKDVMIVILLLAAVVSFVVACFGHDPMEFFEPLLILLIVVLNAVMGMVQESKAEKALDALKNMSAPHARVIRDGQEQVVDAAGLVPGDIIRLEAGDFIPADARLLKSVSLKSEESALTGESVPSEKDAGALVEEKAGVGDRDNMVFSGCSVTYGTATAVVTGTGHGHGDGQDRRPAGGGEGDPDPPCSKSWPSWANTWALWPWGPCAVIFCGGALKRHSPVLEIFMTSVSLAVSAIPEGPARHRHHRAGHRRAAHGAKRTLSFSPPCPRWRPWGSASVICSGQDRHPHPEPHDPW